MAIGITPKGSDGIPISGVLVPGTANPIPLGGTTITTDGLGNQSAYASMAVADGADIAQGSTADAANTNTVVGQLKQIRINTNSMTIGSLPALSSGGATIGNVGLIAGTAVVGGVELVDSGGTNKASISAGGAIKVDNSGQTQPVSGTGSFTVAQSTASNLKVDLSGTAANATAIKVDGSAVTQPVSGTVTATNPSVGTTASAVPASGTYIAANKSGNLVGMTLDGSGNLNVNVAAGGGSGGTSSNFGSAFPGTGTAIGASDGTNMQGLLVESSSNKNLRVGIYNGANEASVDSGGRMTHIIQAVGGTALSADQSNSELRVSNYVKTTTAGDTALTLGQATMANSLPVTVASNQSNMPINLQQILGSNVAATNALPVNIPQIAFLLNGQVYSTSSGLQTNGATGNFPLSIFNASGSGKSILVLSCYVTGVTTSFQAYAFPTTTDPAYATSPTLLNRKPGGSASVASATYTTTSQTLPSTTPIIVISSGSNNPYELFVNMVGYLLPSGANNGITVWNVPSAASKWASTVVWIEY